jgi:PII-like signaling protein
MLQTGKAQKVSIYVAEGAKHHHTDAASAILDYLFRNNVVGATVLKGVAGFGADHHMHTESIVSISDHLPVKVEFIESPEKVQELLPQISVMCGTGMIEVQETTIVKVAGVIAS